MAFEHRDNSGSLFRNEKKSHDAQPNATGEAKIGGVMYRISAWTKEGKKGKFQSLSFTPVNDAPAKQSTARKPSTFDDMD